MRSQRSSGASRSAMAAKARWASRSRATASRHRPQSSTWAAIRAWPRPVRPPRANSAKRWGATQLTGTLDETIGYTLSGPNGGLVIFVKWPKTCWKWHVIPYPCGWNEKDWSLVSWSTYSKTDTLLDRRQSVTVPLQ